jgi:hypothetical protein
MGAVGHKVRRRGGAVRLFYVAAIKRDERRDPQRWGLCHRRRAGLPDSDELHAPQRAGAVHGQHDRLGHDEEEEGGREDGEPGHHVLNLLGSLGYTRVVASSGSLLPYLCRIWSPAGDLFI